MTPINNAAIIPAATLQQARLDAERSHRNLVELLGDMTGLDQAAVMQSLGETFQYPVLAMDDLNQLTPAFDVIDFASANEREAVAFRDETAKLTPSESSLLQEPVIFGMRTNVFEVVAPKPPGILQNPFIQV